MQTEIIVSGFGGQGVLFTGQLLSYTAMDLNLDVTWFPSYGPEMRGGTANCTVIIADEEIGAPVVKNPTIAIVMNIPSLEKYESTVKPDGFLVVDTSMVDRRVTRQDIQTLELPATEIAESLGNKKMTNMVLLGALLKKFPVVPLDALKKSLESHMPARHQKLLQLNLKALDAGARAVQ